jgi:hypothetical protein
MDAEVRAMPGAIFEYHKAHHVDLLDLFLTDQHLAFVTSTS